jgi:hypothetical protein
MSMARIGRRTAAGVATLALGAGLVTAPGAPARAGGTAPGHDITTTSHNQDRTKTVTATCPGPGAPVYGAGARIVDGDGGVVLTSMTPNSDLSAVTVTATARTGHTGSWALTAHAVCAGSSSPPFRVASPVGSGSAAEVECPGTARLVGAGFRFDGPVDHTYVDELTFDPGLTRARVHTGGGAAPASLVAFGICKEPTPASGIHGVVVRATSAHDASWPKSAVTGSLPRSYVYAVGGAVSGSGEFFLSALVPGPGLRQAAAEADRASILPGEEGNRAGADDNGSVTVDELLMGAFH